MPDELPIPPQRRVHFLTLDPGELFRFAPGGRIYRRVVGMDDRAWVEESDYSGPGRPLLSVQDCTGCYVLLVSEEQEENNMEDES